MSLTKTVYPCTIINLIKKNSSPCYYKIHKRASNHLNMNLEDSSKGHHGHDTHAFPPQAICNMYKKYQKMDDASIDQDLNVVDFSRGLTAEQEESIVPVETISSELIAEAGDKFMGHWPSFKMSSRDIVPKECTIYEHKDFPGLRLLPSLLPPECQILILDALLHRDLANPLHKTNLHQDYSIPYPSSSPSSAHPDQPNHHPSFFHYPPHSKNQVFTPINPLSLLKPLNTTQFLHKKLRWLTLGSQYDWSTRSYPPPPSSPSSDSESVTMFPEDIKELVETLFRKAFKPESGVVLLYSSKDYMPVHRDVSEECTRGLASFTVGCDGIFIVSREKNPPSSTTNTTSPHGSTEVENGNGEINGVDETDEEREMEMCVLRVRSGDCVWMGGETRWCWHAMPKILGGTCPDFLESWPVREGEGNEEVREFEKWRGFMKGKRLNISCRQVWN